MARPLIVEPTTERLSVVLMRDCATVDATNVTLTVTRKGEIPCLSAPACPAPCLPPWPRAQDLLEGRWGGRDRCGELNCSACGKRAPTLSSYRPCEGMPAVPCLAPSKTYIAESAVRGVATFRIDQDLTEAPEGWYLGWVAVAGCVVAVLTIWVRCGRPVGRDSSAWRRHCIPSRIRGKILTPFVG